MIAEELAEKRLYENCNCKEKCLVDNYETSVSRAQFPAKPILDDIRESYGFTEDFVRFVFLTTFDHFLAKTELYFYHLGTIKVFTVNLLYM